MNKRTFLIGLLLFAFCRLSAQNEFKHRRITVFKDGRSFIEKTLTTDTKDKSIDIKKLPIELDEYEIEQNSRPGDIDNRITLGSLRFSALNNLIIETKVNRKEDSKVKTSEYSSITELFELNSGKKIKVFFDPNANNEMGTIKKVLNSSLILEKGSEIIVIPVSSITKFEFIDKATMIKKDTLSGENYLSLEFKLQKDAKNQVIEASYLQQGISWLPSYFIDLESEKTGKLTLEANLINDLEDIENTEINFAVGVPAFEFKEVSDPLISNIGVLGLLEQLKDQQGNDYSEGIQLNMMSQTTSNSYQYRRTSSGTSPKAESVGGEDLFFYKKENVSLLKYGRMKTHLLSFDFDYENIYSCKLKQNTISHSYESDEDNSIIWHSIQFKNTSNYPLTTGSLFFRKMKNQQISLVSQNQLNYTPENQMVMAKMSVAPDVLVSARDIEKDRKNVNEDQLLSIDGEINIVNYKSFPIDLLIERQIMGSMISSDKTWEVESNLDTYYSKNKTNKVSWKLKVEAGKSVLIKYKYTILVD